MGIAVDVCTNHPHEILACYGAVINDMVWKFPLMLRTTIVENINKWIYQTTRRHMCIIATILFIIQKKKSFISGDSLLIVPIYCNNCDTSICRMWITILAVVISWYRRLLAMSWTKSQRPYFADIWNIGWAYLSVIDFVISMSHILLYTCGAVDGLKLKRRHPFIALVGKLCKI